MPEEAQTARCDECRAGVPVPNDFAHGDALACRNCGAQLRVLRGERNAAPRLVMADSAPLRTALDSTRQQIDKMQSELRTARASFGIGANGLGIGVLYVVTKIALEDQLLSQDLIVKAVGVAIAVGVLLEAANWLFLAKRKAISRLTTDLDAARAHCLSLQSRIREADRARKRN
jgi:hypothetical protein